MDMAFDLDTTAGPASGGGARGDGPLRSGHPSWPDLVVRMAAAREASGSLGARLRTVSGTASASFDAAVAALIAGYPVRRGNVNPNDLGNCNSGETTSSPVAGPSRTGGRGKR